ncbi:hypothetical protein KC19_12G143900 [Ceratodon purpureus]|uniref:Uncharacterized protein n=1 Tax=Ceratodon purpureus TaxID=3225 RepID=A0A8T0GB83_CERPU|nr:hypothetical protein KC19_12G143900 [Ceratodon purpureus]
MFTRAHDGFSTLFRLRNLLLQNFLLLTVSTDLSNSHSSKITEQLAVHYKNSSRQPRQ